MISHGWGPQRTTAKSFRSVCYFSPCRLVLVSVVALCGVSGTLESAAVKNSLGFLLRGCFECDGVTMLCGCSG